MTNYTVFRLADALYEDFPAEIAKERLALYARHYFDSGNEVKVENFDDEGTLLSRSEHFYNSSGKEIEAREFMGNEKTPFKIKKTEYNEWGKVLSVRCMYEDDEVLAETYQYDHLGRTIRAGFRDEEGEEQYQIWTYEREHTEPKTCHDYKGETCLREITYNYELKNGKYNLIEQIEDVKAQAWDSRIHRLYKFGEVPNGVIQEIYNTDGDFLEEIREIQDVKGNVLQTSWHVDDAEDCKPYQVHICKYDQRGNCLHDEMKVHGAMRNLTLSAFDSAGRKLREYFDGIPATMVIYKYES